MNLTHGERFLNRSAMDYIHAKPKMDTNSWAIVILIIAVLAFMSWFFVSLIAHVARAETVSNTYDQSDKVQEGIYCREFLAGKNVQGATDRLIAEHCSYYLTN